MDSSISSLWAHSLPFVMFQFPTQLVSAPIVTSTSLKLVFVLYCITFFVSFWNTEKPLKAFILKYLVVLRKGLHPRKYLKSSLDTWLQKYILNSTKLQHRYMVHEILHTLKQRVRRKICYILLHFLVVFRPSLMVFHFPLFALFRRKICSNGTSFLALKWSHEHSCFKFEDILFTSSFLKMNLLNYELVFNFYLFILFDKINYIR